MYQITEIPDLPILWLDTHVINQIAFAETQTTRTHQQDSVVSLYQRLVAARKAGKILIFESDQLYELEHRPELVKPSSKILTYLSQGARTHYQHPEKMQIQIAMKAAIAEQVMPPIPWRTAFMDDPFKKHDSGGFFIRAHLAPTPEQLLERRRVAKEIAVEWDKIRGRLVKQGSTERERYDAQLKDELLGAQSTFRNTFNTALKRRLKRQSPTMDEFWQETGIVGEPLSLWEHFGGQNDVDGVHEFLGSSFYTELPYVEISSQLITQEIVTGQKPRPGDIMDIHHIAAFLPYCSHMILDRSMIHNVKTHGIDQRYGTKVLRLNQLAAELDRLHI